MLLKRFASGLTALTLGITLALPGMAAAASATPDSGLSLQVSPSPLVLTVKPGELKAVEIKIFNSGASPENLKFGLQSFTVDKQNGRITLNAEPPREVAGWVAFENPVFTIKPGERFTERATIDIPPTAGFNYNFAMVISRQVPIKPQPGQSAIIGSVAIFTLLDINRPGAARKVVIDSLTTDKHVYEYLPAKLTLNLKNTGNTLLLPAGNIYVQRKTSSAEPISVLPVNKLGLYLLPGVTREFSTTWTDGLPHYVDDQVAANAAPQRHLEWNWRDSHFRIGRYVARAVLIYNDGVRDIPVEADVSFWVIPWKLLIGVFLGGAILLIGIAAIARTFYRVLKRNRFKYRA